MTDRPIIFSGPMVRALLDGRKTQTRRLATSPLRKCQPGDRLWVRENWRIDGAGSRVPADACRGKREIQYRADGYESRRYDERPSIHMPRWASRLTLIVEAVRVEPLQNITLADELAEGAPIDHHFHDTTADQSSPPMVKTGIARWQTPRAWYHELWSSLHGAASWDANPDVLVLTFRVELGNIDRIERAAP